MKGVKTYCFKLYRAKRKKKLHRAINAAGIAYNHCIAIHKRYYRLYGVSLNKYKLQKHLTKLKKLPKYAYLKEIGSQAVQDITDRIDRAYRLFFRNLKHGIRTAPPSFNKVLVRTGNSVGYDFGLKKFLTASNGEDIESPMFFLQNAKAIRKANRNLSRKQKGSNNRHRARLALARLHKKAANQRRDFHFKTALSICGKYSLICLEDLNIKGMQRRWGRKISDLGFSEFVSILKYEATKTGTAVVEIDRYYPSSQTCHKCGHKNSETKDLRVREWTCPKCGSHHDRDRNAARNILKVGASTFFGEAS